MSNLVVWPIILPYLAGVLLIFVRKKLAWVRIGTIVTLLLDFVLCIHLLRQVLHSGGLLYIAVGKWPAPFSIVLVADILSCLLLLTSILVVAGCVVYAFSTLGAERERLYFYSFVLFLLTGVSGAFLTGDIFNLFVFYEVMLISSYVLIVFGAAREQLRESFKYMVINIVSSVLFVISVAYLYAVMGTLNMSHLSQRMAEVPAGGILNVIAVLFLLVFGLKGALFPLYYWLPGSYTKPPIVIGALLGGLLTKVGAYSIYRVFSLIFIQDTAYTHTLIAILAALTMLIGSLGAVASHDLRQILAYNIVAAIGFITMGIAVLNEASLAGGILYMIQDMVVKTALFLLIGLTIAAAGTSDLRKMSGLLPSHPVLGWLVLLSGLTLAGIPPLSGFFGKLQLIQGGLSAGMGWLVAISLISSLLILYSVIRIFILGFWGAPDEQAAGDPGTATAGQRLPLIAAGALLAVSVFIGVGAELIIPFVQTASEQLLNPQLYIQTILGVNR